MVARCGPPPRIWQLSQLPMLGAVLAAVAPYGTMATMSIMAALQLLALGLWLSMSPPQRAREVLADLRRHPLLWPTLALTAACSASLILAATGAVNFYGARPLVQWGPDLAKLWHLFHVFLIAACLRALPEGRFKRVGQVWLLAGLAAAALGLIQHFVPLYKPMELPDVGLRGRFHATGLAGFHLSFAAIIGFPLAGWAALTAASIKRKGFLRPETLALQGGMVLFAVAAMLTFSKTMWVALPLTLLATALLGLHGKSRAALAMAVLVISVIWAGSDIAKNRFTGARSMNDRLHLWSANQEMIRQYPLLGVGWHHNADLSHAYYSKLESDYYRSQGTLLPYDRWKEKSFVSHAHNNLLDQWASTGTLGLLAFLWWNFVVISSAWIVLKRGDHSKFFMRALGLGLVTGWICLHINGMTQTNFWDAKVMHQIAFVAAFALEARRRS